jgi:hypothetical protein
MTNKKYVLRTCNADMTSNGFKWPKRGKVVAPAWQTTKRFGNGLDGALWGEGDGLHFNWSHDAVWQVVRVDSKVTDLGGEVKFKKGYVVYSGDREKAINKIIKLGARGAVIGAFVTSGDSGTSSSGAYGASRSGNYGASISRHRGISKSGNHGISVSRYYGTSKSGDYGTSTSLREATSTSGDYGTSLSGYCGKSFSGDYGTSISRDYGTSVSGYYGTSTSGRYGKSISGEYGTSTSGDEGKCQSGLHGNLIIQYSDPSTGIPTYKTAHVDDLKIKADVTYELDEKGEFVEVS